MPRRDLSTPRAQIGQILGSGATRDNGLISGKSIHVKEGAKHGAARRVATQDGASGEGGSPGLEGKHRGNWEKA